MNLFPRKEVVEGIRQRYPVGCRVVLDHMEDPYREMPAGTQGTVRTVDDSGTIFVSWDNGSGLGVVYGEDRCHKVGTEEEIKESLNHLGKKMKYAICPRCGQMHSQANRLLALSRRADIIICESCGSMEALEDAGFCERMELKDWEVVRADWIQ
jgi:hypothetical protein